MFTSPRKRPNSRHLGRSALGRYCCKSPKLPGDNFPAIRRSDRRPPICAVSITLPRSLVSLSSGDEVPHIFTRKSRLQPGEFLITSAKRLLQQYLPIGDICGAADCTLFDHLVGAGEQRRRHVEREFARRTLRNIRPLKRSHCGLMPANLSTLAHFSVSSAISLPKSAEDPASTVPPTSASLAFSFGSARAALTSVLSFATISAGEFLGAPMPYHMLAS